MKKLLKILAGVLAFISAGLSALHAYRVRLTSGAALSGPKILAGALSPVLTLLGAIAAGLGALLGAPLALLGGVVGATLSGRYVARARHTTASNKRLGRRGNNASRPRPGRACCRAAG